MRSINSGEENQLVVEYFTESPDERIQVSPFFAASKNVVQGWSGAFYSWWQGAISVLPSGEKVILVITTHGSAGGLIERGLERLLVTVIWGD